MSDERPDDERDLAEDTTQLAPAANSGGTLGMRPPSDLTGEHLLRTSPRIAFQGTDRPAIGRYVLLSKLGQGGMGVVYHAVHAKLGTEHAIKVLPLALFADHAQMIERFEREAQLAARLRSDHLVAVLDVADDAPSGCHFIVMEYVHGLTADAWMRRHAAVPRVPEAEALDVVIAATRGLVAAHVAGVVHRDVKPSNILIPGDGAGGSRLDAAKLADLGLARAEAAGPQLAGPTGSNIAMGTPGFMAPEQATDAKRAKKPADVFSMGATLYALLTGNGPFAGSSPADAILRAAAGRYRPLLEVRPDTSRATADLVQVCLSLDPAERFPDASALLEALLLARAAVGSPVDENAKAARQLKDCVGRAERGVPVAAPDAAGDAPQEDPPTVSEMAPPSAAVSPRSRRWMTAAALLVIALAAGAGWIAWHGDGSRVSVEGGDRPAAATGARGLLTVTSMPEGADVFLDGTMIGRTPLTRAEAEPGRHELALRLAQHGDVERTLDVKSGSSLDLGAMRLQPWPVIDLSQIEPGVTATIDGSERAGSPMVSPGRHRIQLTRPGHAAQWIERDCALGESVRPEAEPWEKFQALLDLGDLPPDATVTVARPDDKLSARVFGFAATKVVDIDVARPGFERQSVQVRVELGRTVGAQLRPWVRSSGTLDLAGFGADVSFSIDGRPVRDGDRVPQGDCTVTASRPGHRPQTVTVPVRAGEAARPTLVNWVTSPGTLDLAECGRDVTIEVDGAPYQPGDELAPGNHSIVASSSGFESQEMVLDVKPGGATRVRLAPWQKAVRLLDDAMRRRLLADFSAWDAAKPLLRRQAAEYVATVVSGFKLLRLESFSAGARTHEIAVYSNAATGLEFVLLPGGTFEMGSAPDESGRRPSEALHRVTLTRPSLVARTECTQAAYQQVMGANPSMKTRGAALPVESVSWDDAKAFCAKTGLCLPTEAQWEYACRAGTTGRFSSGEAESDLAASGWFSSNSDLSTHAVAGKSANAFGLFDTHGNVSEWCEDRYGEYLLGPGTDPAGPAEGTTRVFRGGCWSLPADLARSASRGKAAPGNRAKDLGFRPWRRVTTD